MKREQTIERILNIIGALLGVVIIASIIFALFQLQNIN